MFETAIKIRFWGSVFAILSLGNPSAFSQSLPEPTAEFREHSLEEITLGRLLFYDPILSGNKSVSCATCHHPRFATGDGVSLGVGDGGIGIGTDRRIDPQNAPEQRIPRNAPALFNLGAKEFTRFFHDGRLEAAIDRPSGLRTPLGREMERGFDSALSAQAMFPVLSADEMAGHYTENDVAQAVRQGFLTGENGAWSILTSRIEAIPDYRTSFSEVVGNRPITFADIANMIAAFISFEWRADNSPFDQYLREGIPLDDAAMRGMALFFGEAECATCHSGLFQTDHDFHAIGMPQIGPGKAARFERHNRDVGRMRVTGDPADAYRFRTPSLRNVAQTAPYGHAGAYATLEAVIRHHLDPLGALHTFDPAQAVLPDAPFETDYVVLSDPEELDRIADANELVGQTMTDEQVSDILAFLDALTDQQAIEGRLGIPQDVPSGLLVEK